jgi:starch synthase
MYSLCYGTPPIVRATGGLADTVVDAADPLRGNGFVFDAATPVALYATIRRATTAWHDKNAWRRLQQTGMAGDYSWAEPARRYAALYRQLAPL